MDANNQPESQNRRLNVLKRWLAKPPARAHALRLIAVGDPAHTLGEWSKDAITPVLAHEVDALTLEHAEEAGLAECRFLLCYVSETGEAVLSKPLSVRQPASVGANPFDVAAQLDGTERSFLVNQSRHHEAMVRLYISAHQAQTQMGLRQTEAGLRQSEATLGILDKLATRIIESEEKAEAAREELHALREAVSQLQASDGDGEKAEMPEAQKRFFELIEKAAPLILAKLQG